MKYTDIEIQAASVSETRGVNPPSQTPESRRPGKAIHQQLAEDAPDEGERAEPVRKSLLSLYLTEEEYEILFNIDALYAGQGEFLTLNGETASILLRAHIRGAAIDGIRPKEYTYHPEDGV